MKRLLVLLLILATLVCICACQETQVVEPTAPAASQPTDPVIPIQPEDPMVVKMQRLLENKNNFDLFNFALISEYESPADVDMYSLFAYGFKDESRNPTNQERELMGDWIGDDRIDLRRLPIEKINAALSEVFGITLEQTNQVGMDRMWYLEETDCYYGYLYSGDAVEVEVERVAEQDDGTLKVYYRRGGDLYQDMIVTLKPAGESYQIISNVYYSATLGEMQNLLSWGNENRFYNQALCSTYETPTDVDLYYLFYHGFADESQTPTEQELELLEGKLHQYWKENDLIRLPVQKMNTVLKELFGITLNETNSVGLDKFVYLPETGCYYHTITGSNMVDLTVVYTEKLEDGSIMVQYDADYRGNCMALLMPKEEGDYRILSNEALLNLYNDTGVYNAVDDYFADREAYLQEKSSGIDNATSPILTDEAAHLAVIQSCGAQLLDSAVSIQVNGCWDSHSEVYAIETVTYRIGGSEQTEKILHTIHAFLLDDGTIAVSSDGYKENMTGFTSASYISE